MKELLLAENIELIPKILLYAFYIAAIIQFVFFWIVFLRFAFFTKAPVIKTEQQKPVSVIIVAKNEYQNLKRNLPRILEQDYPDFEVILVNHASEDDTEYLIREFSNKYKNLKYVVVQDNINFFSGKKFPLSVGIKSAKNDIVLLTDADCYPDSEHWIASMQAQFTTKKDIVLGYGAYEERKGLLNKIIRYDTLRVGMMYLSMARWGMPYMGVGRNLTYRKQVFFEQNGFQSHYHIPSGDDDLFINSAANRKNTSIAIGKDARTISSPKLSFYDWYYQKKRHLTTGKHYKFLHLFILGIWDISTLVFFSTAIILLSLQAQIITISIILAIRLLSQLIITKKTMLLLGEKKLLLISPLLEILILVLNPIISITSIFTKKRKW
ncbi:MAG: glycosyl transferase family 2 [Bacteroidetes bacterium]|nr:MAG: glycosyl transferase family 2 [Bacteroidota bacterium]